MIEKDKLIRQIGRFSYEHNQMVYEREVVITKEEFIECYNAWIKGDNNGKADD